MIETTLIFEAGNHLCAIPLRHVSETMPLLPVLNVAGSPAFLLGITRVRGRATPVVDLQSLLTGERSIAGQLRRLLVVCPKGCAKDERKVALAVGNVRGVIDISFSRDSALPPLLKSAAGQHLKAIAYLDADLLLVLDSAHLVPESIWSNLSEGRAA